MHSHFGSLIRSYEILKEAGQARTSILASHSIDFYCIFNSDSLAKFGGSCEREAHIFFFDISSAESIAPLSPPRVPKVQHSHSS